VPQARGIDRHVGDYGGPLLSTCTDSGWQTSHRGIQHILFHDIRDHGGAARLEVAGLFTDAAEQLRAAAPPERWAAETREGTYMGYVPDLSSRLSGKAAVLWEAKVMHVNPSCYPQCTTGGALRPPTAPGAPLCRCAACRRTQGLPVARRVLATLGEVKSKLRRLERRLGWNHATQGDGPLLRRLDDLGGVRPLVAGAFGGVNDDWRALLRSLADLAAPFMRKRLLLPSVGQARSVLYKKMCERAHYQLARDRHGHLHDKLSKLLGGGGAAAAHGAAARAREFDRADAAHASAHGRGRDPPGSPPRR
jgi:hypothetical protein